MNNKVNYALIGILVILSISMMVGFGYWLLKPTDDKEMAKYYIHFDESVLGLNIDAPVKYRGINVGKVTKLRINPNNAQQVEVVVNIIKSTPIKIDTVAKLTSQGITGLSYINLSLGTNNAKTLLAHDDLKYPVIKTVPSLFSQIEDSFGDVSDNLSDTLIRTQKLLNRENRKQMTLILNKTASFMDKMDRTFDEKTINNIHESMENINHLTKKLNKIAPKMDRFLTNSVEWEDKVSSSFKSITSSYIAISAAMTRFKQSIASGDFNIKDISSDLVPTMNNTFIEIQQLSIKLEEVLNQYERSPSDIIFKREEIKKGPGEN